MVVDTVDFLVHLACRVPGWLRTGRSRWWRPLRNSLSDGKMPKRKTLALERRHLYHNRDDYGGGEYLSLRYDDDGI
jgi:hypothetical protein